jgi:tetratricopeptide (TPR) repeat protein
MEARKGLADALWLDGRREEAVRHFSELIRLNPNDNQSIRDRLAPALIALGDDEAAEDLLSRYEEDITAAHHFNLALATFRRNGDDQASRERLADAVAANRHVPDLLLGRLEVPYPIPDTYALGSTDEAVLYFLEAEDAWDETPGALEWLDERIS